MRSLSEHGKNRYLVFDKPGSARIAIEQTRPPGPDEVVVHIDRSAVSAGSELVVYEGKVPEDIALDDSIASLAGGVTYPLRYGYTTTGIVAQCGSGVQPEWKDRRVFLFHPHASRATVPVSAVVPVPEGIDRDRALLFPNLETALTVLHDGHPRIGEAVLVLGQGLVGRLLLMLLERSGADPVIAVDPDPRRRNDRMRVCAGIGEALQLLGDEGVDHERYRGFDLVYEVSGTPAALDDAVAATGYGGTIIVGSWYGARRADVALGGRFHRARLAIRSSQVSTIAGEPGMRWTRDRRTSAVWKLLTELPAGETDRTVVPAEDLPGLYARLAAGERTHLQYIISWEE